MRAPWWRRPLVCMHVPHRYHLSRSLSVFPRNLTDNKHYETTMEIPLRCWFEYDNGLKKGASPVLKEIIQFSQWRALDTSERNFAAPEKEGEITQGLQVGEDRFLSYLTSVKTTVTRITRYIYIGHRYITNLEYTTGIVIRDRSLLSTEWARFDSPPFSFLGLIAFHVYNMAQRENSKKRIREWQGQWCRNKRLV